MVYLDLDILGITRAEFLTNHKAYIKETKKRLGLTSKTELKETAGGFDIYNAGELVAKVTAKK